MYATEFQTVVKDGTIQVPDYERFKDREVRVIILDSVQEEASKKSTDNTPTHLESFYAMVKKGNNAKKLTFDNAIDTNGMVDDIF